MLQKNPVYTEAIAAIDSEIACLQSNDAVLPDSIAPEVASFLFSLIQSENPELVVEIGCCHGFSTLHLAKALMVQGHGKLISFDLAPIYAAERVIRGKAGSFVEFIQGNSSVSGLKYFKGRLPCIDVLFIDGDHTRRGCIRDAEVFLPLLKVGGVVILHDIYPDACGWLGPRYLLNLLRNSGHDCFNFEEKSLDRFGIAVGRKLKNIPDKRIRNISDYYAISRWAQFLEIAAFEGKVSPLEIIRWGLS